MARIQFSPAPVKWSRFPAIYPVTLEGNGLVTIRLRPELDSNEIRVNAVPDEVTIPDGGLYKGYSLPVWSAPAEHEELYFRQNVPRRWDGASDITASVVAALDTANTDRKFRLQLAWEHFAKNGVVPATSNIADLVEKDTGTAAQYQSFICDFTIEYDIGEVGNEIKYGEVITARLRRIAASELEITGEVVIIDWYMHYRRDKLGAPI